MIQYEEYPTGIEGNPVIKVYSDTNMFLIVDGYYQEYIYIANLDMLQNITESDIAIPSPIADFNFIVQNLMFYNKPLTQDEILNGKKILQQIIKNYNDKKLYYIKFLIPFWKSNSEYKIGDKVQYNNKIYLVTKNHIATKQPDKDKEQYSLMEKPDYLIEEWSRENTPYQVGDKIKIGNYIYQSTIDDNIWEPADFPAGWQLLNEVN